MYLISLVIVTFVCISAQEQSSLDLFRNCQANGGYLPDLNCRCFYQCDEYRLYHLCCPDGQAFDDKNNVCVPDNQNLCHNTRTMQMFRIQHNSNPTYYCDIPNGMFRHEDCSKFWHCNHQRLYEMSCPEGTLWNDELKICVLPQFTTCSNTYALNPMQSNIFMKIPINPIPNTRNVPQNHNLQKQYDEQLNQHLTKILENNRWLTSATYLTLDQNGKVIYGITKVSKFSADNINTTNTLHEKSEDFTAPEEDNESNEESNEESKDNDLESVESIGSQSASATTESLEESERITLSDNNENLDSVENTSDEENVAHYNPQVDKNDDKSENNEDNSQNSLVTSSQSDKELYNTENINEGSYLTDSTPGGSFESFTDRPENITLSAFENVDNDEQFGTDTTTQTTTEGTETTTQVPNEINTLETTQFSDYTSNEDSNSTTIATEQSSETVTQSLESTTAAIGEEGITDNSVSTQPPLESTQFTESTTNSAEETTNPLENEASIETTESTPTPTPPETTPTTSETTTTQTAPTATELIENSEDLSTESNKFQIGSDLKTTDNVEDVKTTGDDNLVTTESTTLGNTIATTISNEETTESPGISTYDSSYENRDPEVSKSTTIFTPNSVYNKPTVNYEICKEVGGYYADNFDCKCFFVCDLNYRPYHHCCPDGLLFNANAEDLLCDYPDNVVCRDGSNLPFRPKRSLYYKQFIKKINLNHLKHK